MIDDSARLVDLQSHFLATSTISMPIAGVLFWTVAAVAAQLLKPNAPAYFALFGSGAAFPLGYLIDRLRGLNFMRPGAPIR